MLDRTLIRFALMTLVGFLSAQAQEVTSPLQPVKIHVDHTPEFEFSIIPLGIGSQPFATREFWLGGRGENEFKEPPTRTRLAGSIILTVSGKPDWCVLLGNKEVTISQWHSIMRTTFPQDADGQLPVTGMSRAEMALFFEKLNELFKLHSASETVTTPLGGSFDDVFFRLPFENEWEFAARGGLSVNADTFDKSTPYPENTLNKHEWFFSQASSKGKLKQVGLLAPNPLGLYDMLGNATELVESYYRTEYSQGRFGGGLARGGNFRSEQQDVRASKREELPLMSNDGKAYRNCAVGFRLAMGSPVIGLGAAGEQLEIAWGDYTSRRMQPDLAHPSSSAMSETSGKELDEINDLIKSMGKKMDLGGEDRASAKQVLSSMEVRTASILGNLDRANRNFGIGTAKVASIVSINYLMDRVKIIKARNSISEPEMADLFKDREYYETWKSSMESETRASERRLDNGVAMMEGVLKMLGELSSASVEESYTELLKPMEEELTKATDEGVMAERRRQIEATKVAMRTSIDYVANRRVNLEPWKNSLSKMADDWLRQAREQARRASPAKN